MTAGYGGFIRRVRERLNRSNVLLSEIATDVRKQNELLLGILHILRKQGEPAGERPAAIQDQRKELKDGTNPDFYLGRGQQRLQDGYIDFAVEDLFTAIDLAPNNGIALGLAAIAAMRSGNPALRQKVIERYRSASKQLLLDLGEVGKWYSRPPEASGDAGPQVDQMRAAFNAFVEILAPLLADDRERLFWLGEGTYAATLSSVSSKVLARYCRKFPGHQDAEAMLIDANILTCDFEGRDGLWKEQLARLEHQLSSAEPISIDPFNLHLMGVDFKYLSRVCRRRSMDFMPADGSNVSSKNNKSRPSERIRIAFLLPYSWFASSNLMVNALLPKFDRSRFEIYGYALKTNPLERADNFDKEYRKRYDRFVALDGLDAKAAAELIATDGIDVAIDISGHNRATCLPVLAYRPAPIQVHHIGWSSLMEAPYIDYLIADPLYHPKYLQDMSTENFALMPETSWIYYLAGAPTDGEKEHSPHAGPFRFCNFNHPGKIDTQTFTAWMDILRGTDDSVLVQCHYNLGDAVRSMRAYAERSGIDPARLVFLPAVPHEEHLQRLRSMDLALDPLRLGGGATTLDAFWVGLPVVAACTHANYLHACRGAFGSLSMNEEVLSDVSSYVRRAIELRNNPKSLTAFRDKIVARRTGSLMFDPPRYTVEFQRLIEEIWNRHLSGAKPATFTLDPAPS